MKIFVPKITDAGLEVPLTLKEPWFLALMESYLKDPLIQIDRNTVLGHLRLLHHKGEVDLLGHLSFNYNCACDRCLEPLKNKRSLKFNSHYSPWQADFDDASSSDEEEIEISASDLNFSFYKNDEIDLTPILNDEIALNLPYNHYCENKLECDARFEENLKASAPKVPDPRWDALKNFKVKL